MTSKEIINAISVCRLSVQDEKETQEQLERIFIVNQIRYEREYRLDKKNIPDFFIDGIAIELKIKGTAKKIYRQCERYCGFEQVKELILITNRSMGFPADINGKPCYIINIGRAWL